MNAPITRMDNWVAGEDQIFEWEVYEDDDMTIKDISGWTMEFRMARAPGQASVLTKTVNIVDGGNGICQAVVVPTDTQSLPAFEYYYQLWRTNAGFKDVVAYGKAVLKARVA